MFPSVGLGRRWSLTVAALLSAAVLSAAPAEATVHGLNPGFGDDGMVGVDAPVTGLAVSGDRTYVAYGSTVTALTRSGAPDTTFGGGSVTIAAGSPGDVPMGASLSLDAQGRVLASLPYRDSPNGAWTGLDLVRLLPDGSLDTSWDGDGRLPNRRVGLQGYGRTLPDGKVLLHEEYTPDWDYPEGRRDLFVRFLADGSSDTGFGPLDLQGLGYYYALDGVQLLPDGGLVVNRPGQGLSQFTSQGSPDTSFGDGGSTSTPETFGLSRLASGRLLTASQGYYSTAPVLRAYTADGKVDTAFGSGGSVSLLGGCGVQRVDQVVEDAGGALTVVVGQSGSGCATVLQRVTADGREVGLVAEGVDAARPMDVVTADAGPAGNVLLGGHLRADPAAGRVAALEVAGPDPVAVYRYWSQRFGNAHFFTTSEAERQQLSRDANWVYEQVGFNAYPISGTACFPGHEPVYRFWSARFQSHFFTASVVERDAVRADSNWAYEGGAFCADLTATDAGTPVYRFWSPSFGKHHYTTDAAEARTLDVDDPNWDVEGVRFYVP